MPLQFRHTVSCNSVAAQIFQEMTRNFQNLFWIKQLWLSDRKKKNSLILSILSGVCKCRWGIEIVKMIKSKHIYKVIRHFSIIPLITSQHDHTDMYSGTRRHRSNSKASCYWLELTNSICTLDSPAGMLQMQELEKHKSPSRLSWHGSSESWFHFI